MQLSIFGEFVLGYVLIIVAMLFWAGVYMFYLKGKSFVTGKSMDELMEPEKHSSYLENLRKEQEAHERELAIKNNPWQPYNHEFESMSMFDIEQDDEKFKRYLEIKAIIEEKNKI